MNATSPQRIGATDFLRKIEKFHQSLKGKPSKDEITEFYSIIVSGSKSSGKEHVTSATVKAESQTNKDILTVLGNLKVDLGKKKEVIESVAPSIPYPTLIQAINDVERYVKERQVELQKVQGKPSSGMV